MNISKVVYNIKNVVKQKYYAKFRPAYKLARDCFELTTKQVNNLKDSKSKTLFNNILEYLSKPTHAKQKKYAHIQANHKYYSQVRDIIDKLEYVDDKTKQKALKLLQKVFKNKDVAFLNDAEELLDVVNTADNKYLTLGTKQSELFKKFRYSSNAETDFMSSELRYEKLKEYIAKNKHSPEKSKRLYEKYYLAKLPQDVKQICKNISDDFGTKVFLTKNSKQKETAQYIYTELMHWRKAAGNESVKFPSYLDLSDRTCEEFINKKWSGVHQFDDNILINEKRCLSFFRHEMVHLNDDYICFEDVLKYKKFINEMKNAGISDKLINHAFKDTLEFKAVAMGDVKAGFEYSTYSDEFKKCLINELGVPEWMFNLKPKEELK